MSRIAAGLALIVAALAVMFVKAGTVKLDDREDRGWWI